MNGQQSQKQDMQKGCLDAHGYVNMTYYMESFPSFQRGRKFNLIQHQIQIFISIIRKK